MPSRPRAERSSWPSLAAARDGASALVRRSVPGSLPSTRRPPTAGRRRDDDAAEPAPTVLPAPRSPRSARAATRPAASALSGQYPPLNDNPNVDDAAYVEDVIRNGRTGRHHRERRDLRRRDARLRSRSATTTSSTSSRTSSPASQAPAGPVDRGRRRPGRRHRAAGAREHDDRASAFADRARRRPGWCSAPGSSAPTTGADAVARRLDEAPASSWSA